MQFMMRLSGITRMSSITVKFLDNILQENKGTPGLQPNMAMTFFVLKISKPCCMII